MIRLCPIVMRTRETVSWGIFWTCWGMEGMRWRHWRGALMSLGGGLAGPGRVSPAIVMYLVEAVLLPRVLYPLTVATFTPDQIRSLESRALRWILPQIGLPRTFSRALIGSPLDRGGLGWSRWTVRVAALKSGLAMELAEHPSPCIRGTWASMRQRWFLASPLAVRTTIGGDVTDIPEQAAAKGVKVTWMDTYDALLRELDVTWTDGWSHPPPREGDTLIGDLVRGAVKTQAVSLTQARASSADLTWISDLMTPDGTDWIAWPPALRWEWPAKVRALAVAGGFGVCGGWAIKRGVAGHPGGGRTSQCQ